MMYIRLKNRSMNFIVLKNIWIWGGMELSRTDIENDKKLKF